jgi:hypothetical protein
MPRPRKIGPRRKHDRTIELDALQLSFLRTGFSIVLQLGIWTPEEAKAAWERHRGWIIEDWIRERPGTRPQAWWQHDAMELRRLLIRENKPPDYPWMNRNYYGIPSVRCPQGTWETELAYLTRLDLLTDSEKRLIERREM